MINKTDLAEAVGADLDLMKREADVIRGGGPVVMAQVRRRRHGGGCTVGVGS